ncbi:MAG TPA: hypothetical protein VJB99_02930 [Patescibacteria group bacterium]|nr:hypothetical protein [Patescibacteria group bacterium]
MDFREKIEQLQKFLSTTMDGRYSIQKKLDELLDSLNEGVDLGEDKNYVTQNIEQVKGQTPTGIEWVITSRTNRLGKKIGGHLLR